MNEEMEQRFAAVTGMVGTLHAALAMRGVYEELRVYGSEVEGVTQTALSAIASIEDHLNYFRELCK